MSEPAETDALAAEYVLGTLDATERAQAQALLGTDQGFAAKVRVWERRLGELHLMVEPVEPDAELWHRIKGKMPAKAPPPPEVAPPAPAVELPSTPAPAPAEPEAAPTVPPPPPSAPASVGAPTPSTPPPPPPPPVPPPAPAAAAATAGASGAPALTLPPAPLLPTPGSVAPPPEAPAPVPSAPVAQVPAVTPTLREPVAERVVDEGRVLRRRLRRWRVFGTLLFLILLAMGGLVAAWKFAPERVPPKLQAAELLRLVGISIGPASGPTRPPAPPDSQFDE